MGLTALLLLIVFAGLSASRARSSQGQGAFGTSISPPLAGVQDDEIESEPVPDWDHSDHNL